MERCNRTSVKKDLEIKFNPFLDQIKNFKMRYNNFVNNSLQSTFFKPASLLVTNRIKLLEWLIKSLFSLEIESELNNRIMQKCAELEELCEDSMLMIRKLYEAKCLDLKTYNFLESSRPRFIEHYELIQTHRSTSDQFFLNMVPIIIEKINSLLPFDLDIVNKSYNHHQITDLITDFLNSISQIDYEASLNDQFINCFQNAKLLNDHLDKEFDLNWNFIKEHFDCMKEIYSKY